MLYALTRVPPPPSLGSTIGGPVLDRLATIAGPMEKALNTHESKSGRAMSPGSVVNDVL